MKTAKEYRMEAKECLKGKWGTAIGIGLVYSLIVCAASSTGVGAIVLSGALAVGFSYTMMLLIRRKELTWNHLFDGFSRPSFGATIGYAVKSSIFIMLWSMLFVVPGIIAAYRYSMAPYILMDHPEMTGGEAITASKKLMAGKKWKLFCVELSFIGWWLLGTITFGIAYLWIYPWMEATYAAFYESIKDEVPGVIAE